MELNETSFADYIPQLDEEVEDFDNGDEDIKTNCIPNLKKEELDIKAHSARIYQIELTKKAIEQNVIICLPTGSGKTFVALKVTQHFLTEAVRKNQKVILLANTVQLVLQQAEYFRKHLAPLSTKREFVSEFIGASGVDNWSEDDWKNRISNCDVMIMSTEILKNILNIHIWLKDIALIIFDECHHNQKNHSMNILMKEYAKIKREDSTYPLPRILGLTATVICGDANSSLLGPEIKQMEDNMDAKAITYHDYEEVLKYSTNAVVSIKEYQKLEYDQSFLQSILQARSDLKFLEKENDHIEKCVTLKAHNIHPTKEYSSKKKTVLKEMDALLEEILLCYNNLGPIGGRIAACLRTIFLTAKMLVEENPEKKVIYSITRTCMFHYRNPSETGKFNMDNHSPKVEMLLQELWGWKEKGEELCGLIFVQRRITALALYYFILKYIEEHPTFGFVKPAYVIGANRYAKELSESINTQRQQREVIDKFYQKIFNLIICTNVLEEGLNVPACNVIYKFDDNLTYRSLVQSMGRARNRNASYIIFTDNKAKIEAQVQEYDQFKIKLADYLKAQALHVVSDIVEDEEEVVNENLDDIAIPEFRPGHAVDSPVIRRQDAISRVHQYCSILSSDRYTSLYPESAYHKHDDFLNGSMYSGVVVLPPKAAFTEPIYGPKMRNNMLAKQAVFMEVCKKLYELGGLHSKTLLPVRPEASSEFVSLFAGIEKQIDDELITQNAQRNSGNWYCKKTPDILLNQFIEPQSELYAYEICLELMNPSTPPVEKEELYNFKERKFSYGILLKKELNFIPQFDLISRLGVLTCKLKNISSSIYTKLSEDQLESLKYFQKSLYQDMLELKNLTFAELRDKSEYLIVPLAKVGGDMYEISWPAVSHIKNFEQRIRDKYLQPREGGMVFDSNTLRSYEDAIIVPVHRPGVDVLFHVVIGIHPELTPCSKFDDPNKAPNYAEYYKKQYGITFDYLDQPGLRCCQVGKQFNFLAKAAPGKDKKQEKFKIRRESVQTLFPEKVQIFPYPGSLYVQGKLLPSILHRIERFCIAREIRMGVATNCNWNLALKTDISPENCVRNVDDFEEKLDKLPLKPLKDQVAANQKLVLKPNFCINDTEYMNPFEVELEEFERLCTNLQGGNALPKNQDEVQEDENAKARLDLIDSKDTVFHNLDKDLDMDHEPGPSLFTVMEAMTLSGAMDSINLERLEMIGDSVLKLAATLHTVSHFPNYSEGQMTQFRTSLISNKTLRNVANKNNLGERLSGSYFFAEHNYMPRSFELDEKFALAAIKLDTTLDDFGTGDPTNVANLKKKSLNEIIASVETTKGIYIRTRSSAPKGRILSHSRLREKDLADCVEALIGAYYTNGGIPAALKLMDYIGLRAHISVDQSINYGHWDVKPPEINLERIADIRPVDYIPYINELQDLIKYKFDNPWLLVQALTHPSYPNNKVTPSYENLEFLGDAVLDFLVTNHIYKANSTINPGQLTDLRAALVNNVTFGSLVVKYGLQKFMLRLSDKLDSMIDKFVNLQKVNGYHINGQFILLTELEAPVSQDVETPKALGDIFESLAGAIMIDSGCKLDVVWKVFYRLMKHEIDEFSENIPKSPLRLVHELDSKIKILVRRGNLTDGCNYGKSIACINYKGKAYYGVGNSCRSAKEAAAKYIVRTLNLK